MATLISHWKASVSSGSTFVDVTNGFSMTLQGAASFNSNYNGLPAMVCTLTGDYAQLATTDAAMRTTLTTSLAIKIYATSNETAKLITNDDARPSQRYEGVFMQSINDGAVQLSYGDGGNGESNDRRTGRTPASVLPINEWVTVIGVLRSATDMVIYIVSADGSYTSYQNSGGDGTLTYSGTGTALAYGTGPAEIGGTSGTSPAQFLGGISEAWLYQGEIAPADIIGVPVKLNSYRRRRI